MAGLLAPVDLLLGLTAPLRRAFPPRPEHERKRGQTSLGEIDSIVAKLLSLG